RGRRRAPAASPARRRAGLPRGGTLVLRSSRPSAAIHSGGDVGLVVFGAVLGQQRFLPVLLREGEEDKRRAEQDRDDAGGVGPGVALQEGGLGGGDDLFAVAR